MKGGGVSKVVTRLLVDEQIASYRQEEKRLRAKAAQVSDPKRRTKLERNAAGIRRKRIELIKSLIF
jgi:hypothetical protein